MGDKSKIEWTEATWNPWHGCEKVSQGCKNCYMYTEKKAYGQNPSKVVRSKTTFNDPLKWVKKPETTPKFCFTCSWSDFFIKQADQWRAEAWEIIRRTPQITYQILTKRPERIAQCLPADWGEVGYANVWLGVSCENQQTADERIPLLLEAPAAVRWVSAEPLLGAIDFRFPTNREAHEKAAGMGLDALFFGISGIDPNQRIGDGINWVVVGGESGPKARPMHPDWARSIRDQCKAARVPFFYKQTGEWMPDDGRVIRSAFEFMSADGSRWNTLGFGREGMLRVGKKAAGRLLDGVEHSEYPEVAR